jgi:DoxX-like family
VTRAPTHAAWMREIDPQCFDCGTAELIQCLVHHPIVMKNMTSLGWSEVSMPPLGLTKMAIALLTLIPATSFLGVILATGWMGGAIASHLRAGDKNIAFQTALPILIWVGFGLRHQAAMTAALWH